MNLDDTFWNDLLLYLEQKQVIPIIGRDLLVVEHEGRTVNAYRLLAERFADTIGVPRASLPENFNLSHVIAAHPRFRERPNLIYSTTKSVFDNLRLPVPEPLRLLARIPAFRVFVTTTFDPWLEQALNEERGAGGLRRAVALAYSPEAKPDLTDAQVTSDESIVFQLFGRVGPTPNYAVTEEDLLEYLHSLQQRPPPKFCDVLHDHHLLFIGNAFSDWLARFFVRTARGERLFSRGNDVFIVDDELRHNGTLKSFFQGFCWNTSMLESNTPVEFVRALHDKWCERHPPAPPAASAPAPTFDAAAGGGGARDAANHSLFISYASEDAPAAHRLRECLMRYGLNVWLDQKGGLVEGDAYRAKIKRDIQRCTLFLPIVSRNANGRAQGFFREEWFYAIDRLPSFTGSDRPFILPVLVDDLSPYDAGNIPEQFRALHMTRAPGGELPDDVGRRYQQIVRDIIKAKGGAA